MDCRATGDLDLWVRPTPDNAHRIWTALTVLGVPLQDLSVADLTRSDLVFQIGVVPRRIDVLTAIDGVDFDAAWHGRIEVNIEGLTIPIIGKNELIQNKEASGRPQGIADVSRLENP